MTNSGLLNHALYAALIFTLVACGSAPARLPTAIEQANKSDQAAYRAMRDGDLLRAREMFKQSMLRQQAMENISASAMAAINLSSVSHRLGDTNIALDLLEGVLTDTTGLIPTELRAAAAFRKGIILADNQKTDAAEASLQVARQLCNDQCAYVAGMKNLQARLMLEKGAFPAALALAKSVMNAGIEKEERANAHRIAGIAESALGQHEAALVQFQDALALDKELALSTRIAEDLKGIATSLTHLGRTAEAEVYNRRAESVIAAIRILKENTRK